MGERENKDEKDFFIVDKSTGEVVGETNSKNSGAKSALLTIAGVVLGFIAFYVSNLLVAWIIGLIGRIPIIGRWLYYPADVPWATIVLPPIFSVGVGAVVCTKIAGRAAPVCVAIIVFMVITVPLIMLGYASTPLTWVHVAELAATIGTAIFHYKTKSKDLEP